MLIVTQMANNKKLSELARSLHRASERLRTRIANSGSYNMAGPDIENLQTLNTALNRAITKLKLRATHT
jgi:hypothetical protein